MSNQSTQTPFSFEFYPPKTASGREGLLETFDELAALSPSYFSVTYGAGGSTRTSTLDIVETLTQRGDIGIAPHISCIGDNKEEIRKLLEHYQQLGINRLVALRGDLPSGQVGMGELPFACNLVEFIREQTGEHFYIEVAAYPEMHPQARSFEQDIDNLVNKYQAGANAAITQFFYNVDSYLYLRDALEKKGIDTNKQPLIAGIMPIIHATSLMRFADSCGSDIPRYIRKQLADYGDDSKSIKQFGFEVVHKLCQRLIDEGVPALHFYTMNKTEPNKRILQALDLV